MKYISISVFAAFLTFVITSPLKKRYVVNESCVRTVGVTITAWITEQTSHAPTSLIVQKKTDNSQALGSVEVPSIFSITSLSPISSGTSSTPASIVAYIAPTTTSTFTIPSSVVASIATVASAPASRQTSSAVQKQAGNLISTTSPLLETSFTLASIAPNTASTLAAVASATAFAQSLSTSNASGSGACGQIGGACSGDITVYDTTAGLTFEVFQKSGFGACGWLNNGTYENVFALAHGESFIQSPLFSYRSSNLLRRHDGRSVERKPLLRSQGYHHTQWQDRHRQARRQVPGVRWSIHRSLRSSLC